MTPDGRDDERIHRQAERMTDRRNRRTRFWRGLTTVGAVGWMIALPTALGAALGHELDRRLESGLTYGLAGVFLGLCLGAYSVWRFVLRDL